MARPPIALLSALAATAVLLPVGLDHDRPAPASAQLVERPLSGLGAGVTIREVSQRTPFSMVALTGSDLTGTSARVRARHADGSWGPWYDAEALDAGTTTGTHGTEPVFVGQTNAVQISVSRPAAPSHPADLGYRPAAFETPLAPSFSAVLITPPPRAPIDVQWTPPTGVIVAGQPPAIISRAQWGADEAMRCGKTEYDPEVRAAVVHHTAEGNDYQPQDSAGIVAAIYAYHTRTLGWCDIAYNALVDRYGQVFEGRAGGIAQPVEGSHTGGFNRDTWGVAMIGDFETEPPTPVQIRMLGRLLGWRLGLAGVDPMGTAVLVSEGGSYTRFARGGATTLPAIFTHRDVGATECPGNAGYAAMDEIRATAARFNTPPSPEELAAALQGGAIYAHWQDMGAMDSILGAPTSPELPAAGEARFATFEHGAMYWSPEIGTQPMTGALLAAWASLGYERGPLGLPTSAEFAEPTWIGQNFQHGALAFDRLSGTVTRITDGIAQPLLPPQPEGVEPVPAEHFTPVA